VEEGNGTAERSGGLAPDGLAREHEEQTVQHQKPGGVDGNGNARQADHGVMLGPMALNGHVGFQPLTLVKLVAGEGLEGDRGDERVGQEEHPQQVGKRAPQDSGGYKFARVAQLWDGDHAHNGCREHCGCDHVEEEPVLVAAEAEAVERRRDPH